MSNPASLAKARQKAKKRKAKSDESRQTIERTEKVVRLFQADNVSHDWTSGRMNGQDVVHCENCNAVVSAEDMMAERVQLPECGEAGSA
jgi:hypothetical protein